MTPVATPGKARGLERAGIPRSISWGYVGVLLFMIAVGLESSWLSPYLVGHGISVTVVAAVFTTYGFAVSISAWFSGVLFEVLGARRTMLLAFVLFAVGSAIFIGIGIQAKTPWALFVGYAVKGFAYPLFSYSFLVWIAYRANPDRLGAAYGWFWFAFSGGMSVVGAYGSEVLINLIGNVALLWANIGIAALGLIAMIVLNRDSMPPSGARGKKAGRELSMLVTVIKEQPRLLLVIAIRIVNTLPQFAFPIFMPLYLRSLGFPTSQWLTIWGTVWLANIVFNLVAGYVGDIFGWKKIICIVGGIGGAVFTIAFFYTPALFGHNYVALMIAGLLLGAAVAGFVPMDAVVANYLPDSKGAAISSMNFGAGLSSLVGPLIVAVVAVPLGYSGVAWILAALYVFVAITIWFVSPRQRAATDQQSLQLQGKD